MEEPMKTEAYRVEGMTCGGCAKHVERALKSVAGVTSATVDLAKGLATVEGNASQEALAASVAEAGYRMTAQA